MPLDSDEFEWVCESFNKLSDKGKRRVLKYVRRYHDVIKLKKLYILKISKLPNRATRNLKDFLENFFQQEGIAIRKFE